MASDGGSRDGPVPAGGLLGKGSGDAPAGAAVGPAADPARAMLAQARADARTRGRSGTPRRRTKRPDPTARSGSAPDDRDPQPLTTALSRLLAQRGWEVDIAVHAVMARWVELVVAGATLSVEPSAGAGTVDR